MTESVTNLWRFCIVMDLIREQIITMYMFYISEGVMRTSVWERTQITGGVSSGAQFEERVVCPLYHLCLLTAYRPSLCLNQISS